MFVFTFYSLIFVFQYLFELHCRTANLKCPARWPPDKKKGAKKCPLTCGQHSGCLGRHDQSSIWSVSLSADSWSASAPAAFGWPPKIRTRLFASLEAARPRWGLGGAGGLAGPGYIIMPIHTQAHADSNVGWRHIVWAYSIRTCIQDGWVDVCASYFIFSWLYWRVCLISF